MSGKQGDRGGRVIRAVVGMIAAFGARKMIIFALPEALLWGIVIGAGVHTARVLATRAAAKRLQNDVEEPVA